MIAAHELVELERCHRADGEHEPGALPLVDRERLAVAAAAELDRPPAAHKCVVARVEREQHPDAAVGIGAEHDEVAVLAELYVHMRLVAAPVIVLIEPDFHRWVATAHGGPGRGGRSGSSEQEQQRQKHASPSTIVYPAVGPGFKAT